jgi:hypothetical protein
MRTPEELDEVCKVYNIPSKTEKKYVQFGEIFNLLHEFSCNEWYVKPSNPSIFYLS